MKDLCPISLCNVMYKIINKWISLEQETFVHSRSIMDNALTAFEILHHMRCKHKGKLGNVAMKLDISKAFDSISWSYLEAILTKMGFCSQWVSWMLMCIMSVEYHVIFNGDRIDPITPERGLRQGYPISPYLYILCAEGLSSIIKNHKLRGILHATRVCCTTPSISHLLFPDDSFILFKATSAEAQSLKDILTHYENASGQAINYGKSAIDFTTNTPHDTIAAISASRRYKYYRQW